MWKLALLLAFGSCICLVLPLFLGWAKGHQRPLLITAASLAFVAVLIGRQVAPTSPATLTDFRPIEVAGPTDDYASSQSCRDCHESQYETWHASYHRTMTQTVTPDTVLGDFDNVRVEAYGHKFHLTRRGDQFWATMHDPETTPASNDSIIERPIVMSTGSHHMQVYWYATGKDRRLGQLPIVWLNETKTWVPIHSIFLRPTQTKLGSAEGRWNQTCIKCHTTQGRPRIAPEQVPQVDTKVAEFGIACEACHGPGTYHVTAHSNRDETANSDNVAKQERSSSLVNPKELDHKKSADVCGQCHGVWLAKDQSEANRVLGDGFSFRPGDELAKSRHVFSSNQPATKFVRKHLQSDPDFMGDRFWRDGMVRVSGREYNGLIRSPCYQNGKMACTSCHDLHPKQGEPGHDDLRSWANDQLSESHESNDACLSCHQQFGNDESLIQHTNHAANSSGSLCYNCHMPYTTYGLLKAIRSHEVSSPSAQETIDVGRPNACNHCHVDQTLQWTAKSLEDWYQLDAPAIPSEHKEYSATLLAAVKGDAGQRVLAAWALGWTPAQEASNTQWIEPVLGQLLNDPYHAVRYVALRSLKTRPNSQYIDVDFLDSDDRRAGTFARIVAQWRALAPQRSANPNVLLEPNGDLDFEKLRSLLQQRNDRTVVLAE